MEVLVGSTLGIDVSSASAFVREHAAAAAAAAQVGDESETGFRVGPSRKPEEEEGDSSSSSSIGVPDDSDEEGEEDGVASSEDAKGGLRKGGFGSFGSLASLEDSLPIKSVPSLCNSIFFRCWFRFHSFLTRNLLSFLSFVECMIELKSWRF